MNLDMNSVNSLSSIWIGCEISSSKTLVSFGSSLISSFLFSCFEEALLLIKLLLFNFCCCCKIISAIFCLLFIPYLFWILFPIFTPALLFPKLFFIPPFLEEIDIGICCLLKTKLAVGLFPVKFCPTPPDMGKFFFLVFKFAFFGENGLFFSFLKPAVFCLIIAFSWIYCIFAFIFILRVLVGDKFPNKILLVESVILIGHTFS